MGDDLKEGDGLRKAEMDTEEAAGAKIWSVYISEAEKYDKALVESWKSDMEGMLIFAGLFSAILTAFLIESYKTLTPDPGDDIVRLLAQISLQLAGISNGTSVEIVPSDPFVPQLTSLVCNALWFVSLGLSLSCALIATLVEQWAREFQHKSEMRSAPIIRARIFSYLYYGLKRFNMPAVVELIPLLLHASLIIFFVGLVAFLIPVNTGIMILSVFLLALVTIVYVVFTLLPLFYLDCPYRTPLSSGLWRTFAALGSLSRHNPAKHSNKSPIEVSMVDVMGAEALRRSEQRNVRDHRALCWTVRSLTDDAELEPFVEGIPDVLWSSHGRRSAFNEHMKALLNNPEVRLLHRLEHFLRSCDSDLLSPEIQSRRSISAMRALWAIATIPRRDGLFLEPLERFDTSLLAKTDLPFKLAYYQVSTRVVVDLNVLLAVSGNIHDLTQVLLQYKELTARGHLPPMDDILSTLGHIIDRFASLPRYLWQSSADREYGEDLVDLIKHPPLSASDAASWIAQCLGTVESLPRALLALEYEMFASFMVDAATLQGWPYEFAATRNSFSFDEESVSPDMVGTFSTAFDSIVSDQSRRPGYSTHADEILFILLSICTSAMAKDDSYYPLNLANYLTTQNPEESIVIGHCNTLWLCLCLAAHLEAQRYTSALLSAPVIQAICEVSLVMAQQYLDSWTFSSSPLGHRRTLEAVRNVPVSHASPSAIALVKTNILNAWSPLPHDFYNMEALNTVPAYPILPEAIQPSTVPDDNVDSVPGGEPMATILNLRVVILAEFMEACLGAESPYKAVQTTAILTNFEPHTPGVRAAYQVRFARSWGALFAREGVPRELLETLAGGTVLSVYSAEPREGNLISFRWLDDPLAIQIFEESLATHLSGITEMTELSVKLAEIQKRVGRAS
ncbi:hypothetical protein FB451DRAFT_1554099 [Mycena latifolia]|nr:hypothetical protein FB451DRAFT_1554099 [Mycena latifolia]